MAAKKSPRKEITYCIDGSGLVRDVWLEEGAQEKKSPERGWIDFLNWLAKVQAAPTHTVKSFRVVFSGEGDSKEFLKSVKAKKLKPRDFQIEFAGKKTEKVLVDHMKGLVKKEKNVVLVSMESSVHRAARDQGVRCITPQDFLMVFQAVL